MGISYIQFIQHLYHFIYNWYHFIDVWYNYVYIYFIYIYTHIHSDQVIIAIIVHEKSTISDVCHRNQSHLNIVSINDNVIVYVNWG